ncbi:hypothetical protein ACFYXV_06465 [Streptomyces sp. NPDC002181]|uniref:hypothetical protein n=1 Tax=Streptomyces sp. NPDC002181 TaxID=3364635 RepID=UPI0036974595
MSAREIPTLKSQYAEKVAADLDLNTGEQERIREEIASLQGRLAGLEQDHALLVGMRAALGDVVTPVPAPRTGGKTATTAAGTTAAAKKTAARKATVRKPAAKSTASKNTAAKNTAAKNTADRKAPAVKAEAAEPVKTAPAEPVKAAPESPAPAGPAKATKAVKAVKAVKAAKEPAKAKPVAAKEKQVPLAELIHRHLSGQAEPKTAREIAQALKSADPARNVSDNLVRTTTERLVARSLVERVKQGATVYYTALPRHGEADAVPAVAGGAAAGTEKETENTPAPATA